MSTARPCTNTSSGEVSGSGGSTERFGGCSKLLEHYQQTGRALLTFEERVCGSLVPSKVHIAEFSAGVSFVPVEVLETYFDDLLDLGVSDESLFVRKPRPAARAVALLAICVATIAVVTTLEPEDPSGMFLPSLFFVVFLAGLGSALYFIPRTRVIRRFNFATVLSREISKRRGHDRTNLSGFATQLLVPEWWHRHGGGRVTPASVNRCLPH